MNANTLKRFILSALKRRKKDSEKLLLLIEIQLLYLFAIVPRIPSQRAVIYNYYLLQKQIATKFSKHTPINL
jgi:uncharacterized protein YlaN (UPF0358 family)